MAARTPGRMGSGKLRTHEIPRVDGCVDLAIDYLAIRHGADIIVLRSMQLPGRRARRR